MLGSQTLGGMMSKVHTVSGRERRTEVDEAHAVRTATVKFGITTWLKKSNEQNSR